MLYISALLCYHLRFGQQHKYPVRQMPSLDIDSSAYLARLLVPAFLLMKYMRCNSILPSPMGGNLRCVLIHFQTFLFFIFLNTPYEERRC